MLPPSKKRFRSTSDKQNASGRPKRLKKTNPALPKTKSGRSVRLDDLAWKKVSMPDRLDDVEGFFGLEEIDDVGVVREEGKVKFVQLSRGNNIAKAYGEEKEGDGTDDEDEDEDAEEWGGIESSDENKTEEPLSVETNNSPPPAPEPKKSALKKTKHNLPANDPELSTLSFSVLADETPEEDIALPEWASLNLSPHTIRALARLKFAKPTPIQSAAIPEILSDRSLIGKASTGSGKTLAFGIPILEKYLASFPTQDLSNTSRESHPPKDRTLTALIIAPTRELAHQITKHLNELCYYSDLKVVTITGGLSVQKQQRLLDNGVDVIVATPGRLWEIISEGQGWVDRLQRVKMLVLDEADRVLEEGHFKEVEQILALMDAEIGDSSDEESDEEDAKEKVFSSGDVRKKAKRKREKEREKSLTVPGHRKKNAGRQTLVFSATFHKGLQQKLAGKGNKKSWASGDLLSDQESMEYLLKKIKFQEKPEWLDVDPVRTVAEKVKEGILECGAMEKDLYLYYLLLRYPSRTLIFTNSITSVRRLVPFLNNLLSSSSNQSSKNSNAPARVFPLHSQLPQKSRLRSLERFSVPPPKTPSSTYQPPILVATDVAARGLDIPQVSLVIHYHLPRTADMYVHRSGRTGRASAATTTTEGFGSSVILCAPGEAVAMARLVGKVHATTTFSSTMIKGGALQSLDIDRHLVGRLKRRVDLAKKIADAEISRQKIGKEEDWLRTAAEELGVDVSDSEIAIISGRAKRDRSKNKGKKKGGRGEEWDDGGEDGDGASGGRNNGAGASKEEIEKWKWELKSELSEKINKGFSMKYLTSTSGGINLAEHLLNGAGHGEILGEERREVVQELMR